MLRPAALYGRYESGAFVPPPFDPTTWERFLRERGIDLDDVIAVEPALGGLVNANYRLLTETGRWFLRWYRQRDLDAAESELDLISRVAARGFPTPAPVASPSGRYADEVIGWPAALFPFVEGDKVDNGPHYSALAHTPLATDVAHAAARLGSLTHGQRLAGTRMPDPPDAVAGYLAHVAADLELAALSGMGEFVDQLQGGLAEWNSLDTTDLPAGVVHADLHSENVLVDRNRQLRWVLDFDDARNSALVFELVALFPYWARSGLETHDLDALGNLVASYDEERPLTRGERAALPTAALLHQAAEAAGHLSRHERALRDGGETLRDCFSLVLFQAMLRHPHWRDPLTN